MIDEDTKAEMLRAIALTGGIDTAIEKPLMGNGSNILSFSSGSARIASPNKFDIIFARPWALEMLHPSEVRCSLCKRVITFPAWYHDVKASVNHFHYFVCFDPTSPNKVTAKCYRRV